MSKNKEKRDVISEQDYNARMGSAAASPEEDSPGDSEVDTGSEFLMGLNYMPGEDNEFSESGDEPGEIVFSEPIRETPKAKAGRVTQIPETAKVVSSEQPEPWADLDTPSDTH